MKHIEYAALKALGASQRALDFYSNSDPLMIVEDNGIYRVTGIIEFKAESPAELVSDLDSYAEAFSEED